MPRPDLLQDVRDALAAGGYHYDERVEIGQRPTGTPYRMEFVALRADGTLCAILPRWQQSDGSTESKLAWDVICMGCLLQSPASAVNAAYIVVDGDGWNDGTLAFSLHGGLQPFIPVGANVQIVHLHDFVPLASQGQL